MSTPPSALPPSAPAEVDDSLRLWHDRLCDERRFRTQQLAALNDDVSSNPSLLHDEVTMALRSAANAVLADVNAALARMATGRFGRCTRCTKPIPVERLDVMPMAALCMPCQYLHQSGAR